MATNAATIECSSPAAVRAVRRWHPGTRVVIAVALAVVSWAPILIAGAFLNS
ncbi:MAG: hypothetical protein V4618_13160 [Pseudomonadota bacterium]